MNFIKDSASAVESVRLIISQLSKYDRMLRLPSQNISRSIMAIFLWCLIVKSTSMPKLWRIDIASVACRSYSSSCSSGGRVFTTTLTPLRRSFSRQGSKSRTLFNLMNGLSISKVLRQLRMSLRNARSNVSLSNSRDDAAVPILITEHPQVWQGNLAAFEVLVVAK